MTQLSVVCTSLALTNNHITTIIHLLTIKGIPTLFPFFSRLEQEWEVHNQNKKMKPRL